MKRDPNELGYLIKSPPSITQVVVWLFIIYVIAMGVSGLLGVDLLGCWTE